MRTRVSVIGGVVGVVRIAGVVAVVAVAVGLVVSTAAVAGGGSASVRDALQTGIEADAATNPSIPGEILTVRAPGIDETVATGFADVAAQAPLAPDTPFRVASVTKTFVAAAVLRLVEEGKLSLGDPISELLAPETLEVLRADGYDVDAITLKQLLQHTAGFYDYASDTEYEVRNVVEPQHRWTRLEQVQLATELGDPVGAPGEVFNYSDTGYILLGEVLERTTGETLPATVRALIPFDELGLDDTYWETLEDAPPGLPPRAHQYFGDSIDNIGYDASQDLYGGGGLVSTTSDLARFYEGLFTGKVLERPSSLKTMTRISKAGREDEAGMGIFTVDVAGERCFGHRGFWGTQAIYCPDLDLAFARTTNQGDDGDFDSDPLERIIVREVERRRA